MKQYKMAEALADLPDDLLLEAADVKKRSQRNWLRRIVAAAATLALIFGGMWLLDSSRGASSQFSMYVYADGMDVVEVTKNGNVITHSSIDIAAFQETAKEQADRLFLHNGPETENPWLPNFEVMVLTELIHREYVNGKKIDYDFTAVVNGEVLKPYKTQYAVTEQFQCGIVWPDSGMAFYVMGHAEQVTYVQIIMEAKDGSTTHQYEFRVSPYEGVEWKAELIRIYVNDECTFESTES